MGQRLTDLSILAFGGALIVGLLLAGANVLVGLVILFGGGRPSDFQWWIGTTQVALVALFPLYVAYNIFVTDAPDVIPLTNWQKTRFGLLIFVSAGYGTVGWALLATDDFPARIVSFLSPVIQAGITLWALGFFDKKINRNDS